MSAIHQAYLSVDNKLKQQNEQSGCTAVTCMVQDGVLYTANVGDARIVLSRNGIATRLSYDHKASDPEEKQRIAERGGFVVNGKVASK